MENISICHEQTEDDYLLVFTQHKSFKASVPQMLADKSINAFGIQKIWNALPMITK